jgi:hypothetical protein
LKVVTLQVKAFWRAAQQIIAPRLPTVPRVLGLMKFPLIAALPTTRKQAPTCLQNLLNLSKMAFLEPVSVFAQPMVAKILQG